jgi:hypothetical protein
VQYADDDLFGLLDQEAKKDLHQPEALQVLWQSQNFGVPVYDAPLKDWPHILLKEMTVTMNAIADHKKRIVRNAEQKMAFIEKQKQQQG